MEQLADCAHTAGVEVLTHVSALDDFNEDLRRLDAEVMRDGLRTQLAPEDRVHIVPT